MKRLKHVLLILTLAASALLLAACGTVEIDYRGEGYTAMAVFDFMGGELTTDTANVSGKISYAYRPDSLVVDPLKIDGYSIKKENYEFAGWYKDEQCTVPWDFSSERVKANETRTVYAKWVPVIKYTYTLCYIDENSEEKQVYSYRVNQGDTFKDTSFSNLTRKNYTPHYDLAQRYYSDSDYTIPWNGNFEHPGGEQDTDVKIYVNYIEGEWNYVSDYSALRAALTGNKNAYIINDVDCKGATWVPIENYSAKFYGRGYVISNIKQILDNIRGETCIVRNLSSTAEIKDVKFANVTISTSKRTYRELNVSSFALNAEAGCVINKLSVSGTFIETDGALFGKQENGMFVTKPFAEEEINKIKAGLGKAVFNETEVNPTDFESNFVYEKQS